MEEMFKGLTFEIKPGTSNALVGPSGFGKTTIFNMIYRLFDPSKGNVSIDGQNLKDLQLKSLREKITIVPQNGLLFNDTIINNLRYGNPDATQ